LEILPFVFVPAVTDGEEVEARKILHIVIVIKYNDTTRKLKAS